MIHKECPHCGTEFDPWYYCPKCDRILSFEYCDGFEAASDGRWKIGDKVVDEDGYKGWIGIMYEDGDFCTIENDAAHPNPKLINE